LAQIKFHPNNTCPTRHDSEAVPMVSAAGLSVHMAGFLRVHKITFTNIHRCIQYPDTATTGHPHIHTVAAHRSETNKTTDLVLLPGGAPQ